MESATFQKNFNKKIGQNFAKNCNLQSPSHELRLLDTFDSNVQPEVIILKGYLHYCWEHLTYSQNYSQN